MTDFNEYDDFLKDAAKDDRLGKQVFMVAKVTHDFWESGDPRTKVDGVLTSARGAKVNFTLSEIPEEIRGKSKEEIKTITATWETRRVKGVAQSIQFHKALGKLGKTRETLAEGDEFGVEVVKNKEGFLRIAAILGVPAAGSASRSNDSDIPF